jgi:hypothetical protein
MKAAHDDADLRVPHNTIRWLVGWLVGWLAGSRTLWNLLEGGG